LSHTSAGTVDGDERIRLFCALELPGDVLDAIVDWQARELAGTSARLVPRTNLHVTLAFLGWQPASRLPEVVEALRRRSERLEPPELVLDRYRETRSVGMLAFGEHRAAARLANGLQRELLGKTEGRPWLPHVTVLRFRDRPRLRKSSALPKSAETSAIGRFRESAS